MKIFLHLLLLIVCCVAGSGASVATDTKPVLVRTDRVWEYVESFWDFNWERLTETLTRFRFGEEEERFGRTYTRLERIYYISNITQSGKLEQTEVDRETVCTALLREEDGKVYILNNGETIAVYDGCGDPRDINSYEQELPATPDAEYLLYDFSSPVGTVEEILSRIQPIENSEPIYMSLTPAMVSSVTSENYGDLGELRKVRLQNGLYTAMLRQSSLLSSDGEYDFSIPENVHEKLKESLFSEYLEGIGNVGIGTLTEVGTLGGINMKSNGNHYVNGLNNVYDLEGNIIYEGLNMSVPYPKMLINSDRVWEYGQIIGPDNEGVDRYEFRNIREEDHRWKGDWTLVNSLRWNTYGDPEPTFKEQESKICTLIEDEKGVWIQLEPGQTMQSFDSSTRILSARDTLSESVEVMLYPNAPKEGESFPLLTSLNIAEGERVVNHILNDCLVMEVQTESNMEKEYRKVLMRSDASLCAAQSQGDCEEIYSGKEIEMHLDSWYDDSDPLSVKCEFTYVEGIGNIGRGEMVNMMPNIPMYPTSGLSSYYFSALNNVYDRDGNTLFKGIMDLEIPEINTIEGIAEEADGASAMFDLMGRRIAKPLPGTVYIRGGRKFVAR